MSRRLYIRARINARVKAGGHFVPPEDVKRRYARSKKNFVEHYMKAADRWKLVYNGVSQSVLVASGDGSDVAVINVDLYSNFKEGV